VGEREPLAFPIGGIDDGVVRLRFRTDADMPRIVEACRDPEIPRWTRVPEDYGEEDAREFMARAEREAAAGEALTLAVADAADDSFLGSCGVIEIHPGERRCEIGYWLAPWARGRGVMSRAVLLLCRWLFEELGMERIAAGAEPENEASQALLARAGFTREGVARSLFEEKGRRRDVVYWSLLPGELPQGD
jgi:RimJ/RimL family protein N-acetyltransferase